MPSDGRFTRLSGGLRHLDSRTPGVAAVRRNRVEHVLDLFALLLRQVGEVQAALLIDDNARMARLLVRMEHDGGALTCVCAGGKQRRDYWEHVQHHFLLSAALRATSLLGESGTQHRPCQSSGVRAAGRARCSCGRANRDDGLPATLLRAMSSITIV